VWAAPRGCPCPVFGSIDDYVGIVEHAMRRLEAATGEALVIVAHSMGRLAVRRWWVEQGDETRVRHVLTIDSPHHGTWLARFARARNGRQMQRVSRWLQALAAREPAPRRRAACADGRPARALGRTRTLAGGRR
jgi:alpha-beta hydrolase superfamily lysophospholipase